MAADRDQQEPRCYRTLIGVMVHGPGCEHEPGERMEMTPSEAARRGICPMCFGSGKAGALVLSLTNTLVHEGDPCPLCHGSGKWPPDE